MIDVCRVGNDSLAITLSSAFIFCAVLSIRREALSLTRWAIVGAFLGAALLTKTYALALVPLLVVIVFLDMFMRKRLARSTVIGALIALLIAVAVSGWWYLESWRQTGTFSGEQLDALAAPLGIGAKLSAISVVDWPRVVDSAAISHIWVGGWSFLIVRSWIYRGFELLAAAAICGIITLAAVRVQKSFRRKWLGESTARLVLIACAFLLACSAVWYDALVVFTVKGMSVGIGWYLYPAITIEFVLLACGFAGLLGLRRGVILSAGTALLALALDLYTMHFVLIPHYTGLMTRKPSGSFAAVQIADLIRVGAHEIFVRIAVNKPPLLTPAVIGATWVLYILSTASLALFCAIQITRSLQTHEGSTPKTFTIPNASPLRRNAAK